MQWMRRCFRTVPYLALVCLAGCGGETNSGINCRFAISERFEQVCADGKCTCRLTVSIQNVGTQSVSGALHYDAFDAGQRKIARADFLVVNLTPGTSRELQNDLLDVDTGKPLKDCTEVATVAATTTPGC